jgi:hypothetical protein
MAQQFDNTIALFSRPASIYPAAAAAAFVTVSLTAGLLAALAVQSWLFVLVFLLAIGGFGAFAYLGYAQLRRISVGEPKRVEWDTASPELQRTNMGIEVGELSRILEVGDEQISDLQTAYIVAEDLALRRIQHDENVPLLRHVHIGGVPFDAVMLQGETIVCLEVMFLVTPDIRQDKLDAVMRKIAAAGKAIKSASLGSETRLMLVLVTQLVPADEKQLRSVLNRNRFADTPVDIDIRLHDFEELQKLYITD